MAHIEADPQYHVTAKSPISLKLGGRPVLIRCFDATITEEAKSGFHTFRIVKVWQTKPDGSQEAHKIAQTLLVPVDNIAGLVAQPFDK